MFWWSYGTDILLFVVLMAIALFTIGVNVGKWGYEKGKKDEIKNPSLLLERVLDSLCDTRKIRMYTTQSIDVLIDGFETLKIQIAEHRQYMNAVQNRDADRLVSEIDDRIEEYKRYKTLIIEDRAYKREELI